MKFLNRVTLIGNVGSTPEVRYTAKGLPVTTLSLATNSSYKNKDGEWFSEVQWHSVTLFDKQVQPLLKGQTIYIEGGLKYRTFTNKTGAEVRASSIVATHILVSPPKDIGNAETSPLEDNPPADDDDEKWP